MAYLTQHENRHYDTIVLGAGISGLAAASKLFEHPTYQQENKLLVLEARDRIGGRIGAVNVNGCRLDTGANWIHGIGTDEEPNPLMKILPHKKFKGLTRTVAFKAPEHNGSDHSQREEAGWVHIDSKGLPDATGHNNSGIIPAKTTGKLMELLWGLIGSLHDTASQTPASSAKHTSILQAITSSSTFKEAFRNLPEEYHHTFSAMPQFIENMEAAPLVAQSAETPLGEPGVSLLEFGIDDFDGAQVFLRDGYTAIVNEVAQTLLSANLIRTHTQVLQIRYDTDPIEIVTNNRTYTAKSVICTLPLGVLQHHQRLSQVAATPAPPLFHPALPEDKAEAISSLGFGTLDKIFLVYSSPWWTTEPYITLWSSGMTTRPFEPPSSHELDDQSSPGAPDTIIGFTSSLAGLSLHPSGSTTPAPRVLTLLNLHALTGYPVLSAFLSCANARQIEPLSDTQASATIHHALTIWLGSTVPPPPEPDAVHVTRWAQDEFVRGSYSHMVTGKSEVRHREAFWEPLGTGGEGEGGKLRFAGEHTSRNHFATVHGALLSGWREAGAILGEGV